METGKTKYCKVDRKTHEIIDGINEYFLGVDDDGGCPFWREYSAHRVDIVESIEIFIATQSPIPLKGDGTALSSSWGGSYEMGMLTESFLDTFGRHIESECIEFLEREEDILQSYFYCVPCESDMNDPCCDIKYFFRMLRSYIKENLIGWNYIALDVLTRNIEKIDHETIRQYRISALQGRFDVGGK